MSENKDIKYQIGEIVLFNNAMTGMWEKGYFRGQKDAFYLIEIRPRVIEEFLDSEVCSI